jgi:myo-inositol 2-dehydrogenase / D-chiro-inositol 1-dehydrogenase
MAGEKARVGFIGSGGMAEAHLQGLPSFPDVEIAAFCDVAPAKAEKLAAQYGAKAYSDPKAMFADQRLDCVYVLLPPFAHGDAELAAIEAKVPFFVEKPIGLDLPRLREIAAGVREANLITAVGYMTRYRKSVQRAREVFQQDPPIIAYGGWLGGRPRGSGAGDGIGSWWVQRSKSGGQFVEQVTHTVDLVRYLLGDVEEVFTHATRAFNKSKPDTPPNYDIEDASVVNMKFKSGAIANIMASCATGVGGGVTLNVFSENHAALFEGWGHNLRLLSKAGEETREETIPGEESIFSIEDRAFIDAVKSGNRSGIRTDYADGLKTAEVALAANRSMETGEPVRLMT